MRQWAQQIRYTVIRCNTADVMKNFSLVFYFFYKRFNTKFHEKKKVKISCNVIPRFLNRNILYFKEIDTIYLSLGDE